MIDLTHTSSHRRGFLGRLGALAGLGLVGGARDLLAATVPARQPAAPAQRDDDEWLKRLHGKHRQLFDMAEPGAGVPLLHIRNWLSTYNEAYHVPDSDLNAVGTFYGKTVPLGLSDEMWAKYPFGATLQINDPATKAPITRNMFLSPKEGDDFAFGFYDSGVTPLMRRGTTFILCNNALNFWVGRLSQGGLGTKEAIRADLLAHMVPGVVLVPAMVIAINKAQEAGLSYMKV